MVSAGAILLVNCRRFIITSADLNDYRYMQQHPELFSKEGIESVREYLISVNCLNPNEEVCTYHLMCQEFSRLIHIFFFSSFDALRNG